MKKLEFRSNWLRTSLWRLTGLLTTQCVSAWMQSLHCRIAEYDRTVDPTLPEFSGPVIYLYWHEYIPLPFYLRGHCRMAMLVSQHHDAELLNQSAFYYNCLTIRGSTTRGGASAVLRFLRNSGNINLVMTPDGPRGPRRKLASGCIFMSSKLQIPLVLIGCGFDRPWRIQRAWDQFAVPRPGSQARLVLSPRIQIPPNLERHELESHRADIETMLNQVTLEAETWAVDGRDREGSRPIYRKPNFHQHHGFHARTHPGWVADSPEPVN